MTKQRTGTLNEQKVKEELIQKLGNLKKRNNSGISHNLNYTMKLSELELVADFVIEDRKRIVQPLVKLPVLMQEVNTDDKLEKVRQMTKIMVKAIDQTLSNTGIEE